jgi:hypothetical protein
VGDSLEIEDDGMGGVVIRKSSQADGELDLEDEF